MRFFTQYARSGRRTRPLRWGCPQPVDRGTIRCMSIRLARRPPASHAAPRLRPSWPVSVLMIASLAACGGSPSPTVRPAKTEASAATAAPQGGALSAQLARTLPADGASTAVVAFAVLRPEPLDDAERAVKVAEAMARKALERPPLVLARFAEGAPPMPSIVAAPVDAELPLDMAALAADAGEAAPRVEQARSAIFVRYAGRALEGDRHLRGAALATAGLLSPGAAVVDLGTRRVWTNEAFFEWLTGDDWLADQLTVDAEQAEDGTVTLFTRGMARFGLPDLEAGGIAPASVKARFQGFQAMMRALIEHGPAKPGDTVNGTELGRCRRPAEAIERACVSM